MVNDYDHVVNHELDKLNQCIISGIPKSSEALFGN